MLTDSLTKEQKPNCLSGLKSINNLSHRTDNQVGNRWGWGLVQGFFRSGWGSYSQKTSKFFGASRRVQTINKAVTPLWNHSDIASSSVNVACVILCYWGRRRKLNDHPPPPWRKRKGMRRRREPLSFLFSLPMCAVIQGLPLSSLLIMRGTPN